MSAESSSIWFEERQDHSRLSGWTFSGHHSDWQHWTYQSNIWWTSSQHKEFLIIFHIDLIEHYGWFWVPITTRGFLSSMCGHSERSSHYPLWWHFLPGVHQDLLGSVRPHWCVQLPTVPCNIHTSACPEAKPARCIPWATTRASRAYSFPLLESWSLLWLLHWPSQQSRQVLSDVFGILLWNTCQASLWVIYLQAAQTRRWDGSSGQKDLPTTRERFGAVLSHWPDVYLCAVYCQRAPQPQHYLGRRRTQWETSEVFFYCCYCWVYLKIF